MKVGARVEVRWLDIVTGATDEPTDVKPCEMVTRGYFVGYRGKGRRSFLLISDTRTTDCKEFYGATAFPIGCVISCRKR